MRKKTPVAICTKCKNPAYNSAMINQPCHIKFIKKGKCKGVYRSMLAPNDWSECVGCSGTGVNNGNNCEICRGLGWICTRKDY